MHGAGVTEQVRQLRLKYASSECLCLPRPRPKPVCFLAGYWGYGNEYQKEDNLDAYKAVVGNGITFIDTSEVCFALCKAAWSTLISHVHHSTPFLCISMPPHCKLLCSLVPTSMPGAQMCKLRQNSGKNAPMSAGIWPWPVRGVPTGLHETDWHPARHSNQVCATALALQGAKRR